MPGRRAGAAARPRERTPDPRPGHRVCFRGRTGSIGRFCPATVRAGETRTSNPRRESRHSPALFPEPIRRRAVPPPKDLRPESAAGPRASGPADRRFAADHARLNGYVTRSHEPISRVSVYERRYHRPTDRPRCRTAARRARPRRHPPTRRWPRIVPRPARVPAATICPVGSRPTRTARPRPPGRCAPGRSDRTRPVDRWGLRTTWRRCRRPSRRSPLSPRTDRLFPPD